MTRAEQRLAAALSEAAGPVDLPEGAGVDQLCQIATESLAQRAESTESGDRAAIRGGHAISELIALGWTYRSIHRRTGVSKATAGRWLRAHRAHARTEGEK